MGRDCKKVAEGSKPPHRDHGNPTQVFGACFGESDLLFSRIELKWALQNWVSINLSFFSFWFRLTAIILSLFFFSFLCKGWLQTLIWISINLSFFSFSFSSLQRLTTTFHSRLFSLHAWPLAQVSGRQSKGQFVIVMLIYFYSSAVCVWLPKSS